MPPVQCSSGVRQAISLLADFVTSLPAKNHARFCLLSHCQDLRETQMKNVS